MAREVIHRLVDDLDGSEAAETVRFALDGRDYELDLSADNADTLREALAPYIAAGRTERPATPRARGGSRRPAAGHDVGAVREWARARGYRVSGRGRVAHDILAAYDTRETGA